MKGARNMSRITYQPNGDYLIPNLTVEKTEKPLGRYGRIRKDYLQKHQPMLFQSLLLTGKLYPHLLEIEETANSRMEQLLPQLMEQCGVTEQLKADDMMKWVGLMNNCKAQAEELILNELIYS